MPPSAGQLEPAFEDPPSTTHAVRDLDHGKRARARARVTRQRRDRREQQVRLVKAQRALDHQTVAPARGYTSGSRSSNTRHTSSASSSDISCVRSRAASRIARALPRSTARRKRASAALRRLAQRAGNRRAQRRLTIRNGRSQSPHQPTRQAATRRHATLAPALAASLASPFARTSWTGPLHSVEGMRPLRQRKQTCVLARAGVPRR